MRYQENMRRPPLAALLGTVVLVVGATSCSDLGDLAMGRTGEEPQIHNGVRGPAKLGAKVSWGAMDVCVRGRPVTITGIRFSSPGARVVDAKMYVRDAQSKRVGMGGPDLLPGGTAAVGAVITQRCSHDVPEISQEFDVVVERLDPAEVSGQMVIDYENARGERRTLDYSLVTFVLTPVN